MYRSPTELSKDDPLKVALAKYFDGLERAAESFDKERLAVTQDILRLSSAQDAIMATVRFLMDIDADAYLCAPLMEAVDVLHKGIVPDTMPKGGRERVYQAVAVKFQIEFGLSEKNACKKVLGSGKPIKTLQNFIAALTRKSNPYPRERDLYFSVLAEYKLMRGDHALRDLNGREMAEFCAGRSLAVCRQMRGDRGAAKFWRYARQLTESVDSL